MADITDDLTELRKWIDKATQGPWFKAEYLGGACTVTTKGDHSRGGDLFEHTSRPNAGYIAACSPDRIRRVVDECEWLQRENEVLAAERDHARSQTVRTTQILVGIHRLLHPPRMTLDDGRVMEFRNPDANATLQALSDRVRAIPDEIAAMQEQPR